MLIFDNKGLIDLDAIRIMGVSVKEGNTPFGKFGTGIKYGLSVLLREGCEVFLFRDGKKYDFFSKPVEIRGKEFNQICMGYELNGKPHIETLAFTTDLGKEWEMWQAYREFYCNCRDEGGEIRYEDNGAFKEPSDGKTIFVVRGAAIDKTWMEQGTIILRTKPTEVTPEIEIHMGRNEFLYYRGVRVHKLSTPSNYTYNILSEMALTEDRTLKYSWQAEGFLARVVAQSTSKEYLTEVLSAEEGWESKVEFKDQAISTPSKQFMETAIELKADKRLNRHASGLFHKFVSNSRSSDYDKFRYAEVTPAHKTVIDESFEMLMKLGVDMSVLPIRYEAPKEEGVLEVRGTSGIIYADIRQVEKGAKNFAVQLLIAYAEMNATKEARAHTQLAHKLLFGDWAPKDSKILQENYAVDEMPF